MPDIELAKALVNFIRLGCNLSEEQQVFITARPSTLPQGSQFGEVIREALDKADIAILLLTPSYYESHFCLAEAGAVWVQEKPRIPLVVPPVDYHDLEGVQLGEQAAKIDSSTALDEMRDQIRDVVGTGVATGTWNEHKTDFLNLWTTGFDGQVPLATAVPFSDLEGLQSKVERLERENLIYPMPTIAFAISPAS
jgi:hypothetical protein